jgi:hypothetical protein
MGRRRTQRGDDTLRALLLNDHRKRFGAGSRWHTPGQVSEYETALLAGEAVVVDSATLMCALLHGGMAHEDFAFGGRYWNKQLLLDVDGSLTEWAPEDE